MHGTRTNQRPPDRPLRAAVAAVSVLTLVAVTAAACGGGSNATTPVTTPSPTTTAPPTTTTARAATTTTTAPAATTTTRPPTGPLLSLPVGPGGIEYLGGGPEQEITGPSRFTIDSAGGVHLYDPAGKRVLSVTDEGEHSIALVPRDILNVVAIDAADDYLLLAEVFFAPARQRVHRLSYDGTVLETLDLPSGFRLESGLTGVRSGPDGEIVLELEGGARYGIWNGETFEGMSSLQDGETTVTPRPPDLVIDGEVLTADLTTDLGSLNYLGTAQDGAHLVIREDVVAVSPVFQVLTTVEWYSPTGDLLGSARVPSLQEQYISAAPGIAFTADGRAFALVATADVVEVVELIRTPGRITEVAVGS